jgi:O-acetyl-ADP-ribose deacetylase (regulator of RNase III)
VILVRVDDLASVKADAILRPTDETLAPLTPAISALDQNAGPRFAEQRRLTTPLKAGAAVVTGSGDLTAPYVLHVVLRDGDVAVSKDVVRRALISAWQRATDWELSTIATPLVGAGPGQLSIDEAATLLAETFPSEGDKCPAALHIVLEHEADRERVESIIRRIA